MFYSKRSFFLIVGLAVFAAGSGWMVAKNAMKLVGSDKLPPDFVTNSAIDLTYTKLDASGQKSYKAHAKKADYFSNQDALMTDVTIVVFPKQKTDPWWTITANYAKVTDQQSQLEMYGDVKASRPNDSKGQGAMTLLGDHVFYLPKTDEMHSDDWVTIYQPQTANKIVGKGMKGHPKLNEFTLLSQVRSYYEQFPDTDN